MDVIRNGAARLGPADAANFLGAASAGLVGESTLPGNVVRMYHVAFEPGARNNWHTHSGPQLLVVLEGRCRVQVSGQAAVDLDVGDAVLVPPGEKHWHGSTPGVRGVHLAVNINAATDWLERVTDEQYAGR